MTSLGFPVSSQCSCFVPAVVGCTLSCWHLQGPDLWTILWTTGPRWLILVSLFLPLKGSCSVLGEAAPSSVLQHTLLGEEAVHQHEIAGGVSWLWCYSLGWGWVSMMGTVCVGVPQSCRSFCQQLAFKAPMKNGTISSTAASRARLGNIYGCIIYPSAVITHQRGGSC